MVREFAIKAESRYPSATEIGTEARVKLVIRLAILGVTAGWVAFATTPSFAQGGTPAENAACRPDVVRLCRNAAPDSGRVLACLQANRGRLSRSCIRVLAAHGQ
jgi:cysteine rich repeat protein